jgi:hypothetical protein
VTDAFFVREGELFVATAHTRGPWSLEHQHAGPSAALLGRAIEERLAGSDLAVVRMTLELLSPIPIGPLGVDASVSRAGRKVQRLDATLSAGDRVVARASALAIRAAALPLPATRETLAAPGPAASVPFEFEFFAPGVSYATAMESRRARGQWGAGPLMLWMRPRVPLVAGEAPSPLQRVLIAADSGNGIAVVLDPERWTFVNADLTVTLHRPPAGEWIGLDAHTTIEPTGVGLTVTRLADERGPIGVGLQSLVVDPRV